MSGIAAGRPRIADLRRTDRLLSAASGYRPIWAHCVLSKSQMVRQKHGADAINIDNANVAEAVFLNVSIEMN
jgi:hypothetical protein